MSVHVMSLVWKCDALEPKEKLVLLKLADTANDEGESAYPSVGTIERETCLSEASVHRAIKGLIGKGLIIPDKRHERRRTVVYRLDLERLRTIRAPVWADDMGVTLTPSENAGHGCHPDTHMGVTLTPNPSFNHPIPPLSPLPGSGGGDADVPETPVVPSVAVTGGAVEALALWADFERAFPASFWASSPLKVREEAWRGRAIALRARAEALLPAAGVDAASAVLRPLIRGRFPGYSAFDADAVARTWAMTLKHQPVWAIEEAVRRWLEANAANRRKPVLGDLVEAAERSSSPCRRVVTRCAQVEAAPLWVPPEDISPEQRAINAKKITEMLDEALGRR